jgi:hypothetical protein
MCMRWRTPLFLLVIIFFVISMMAKSASSGTLLHVFEIHVREPLVGAVVGWFPKSAGEREARLTQERIFDLLRIVHTHQPDDVADGTYASYETWIGRHIATAQSFAQSLLTSQRDLDALVVQNNLEAVLVAGESSMGEFIEENTAYAGELASIRELLTLAREEVIRQRKAMEATTPRLRTGAEVIGRLDDEINLAGSTLATARVALGNYRPRFTESFITSIENGLAETEATVLDARNKNNVDFAPEAFISAVAGQRLGEIQLFRMQAADRFGLYHR